MTCIGRGIFRNLRNTIHLGYERLQPMYSGQRVIGLHVNTVVREGVFFGVRQPVMQIRRAFLP